ncbi:MAG TPA: hypothetical protein IAC75_04395 [Candidatus Spyradosoma merdigallinarum]|uniref:Uncharacterized protein n=1 Tax=Candidatus Spyradosoma merdigallinarum TaxID=2840950 RepID=A0A9D1T197_9BACT|nr:hypothetical protein [Candidatus Spyradosoma merdigallinarum]
MNKVEDVVKLGDEIIVKCVGVDEKGRVRLSRRAAIAEKEGRPYEPKAAEPRGGDRPRRGDRGGSRRSRGDRPHRDVPAGE